MKVSVKKISEETGFSPATVSNALNNKKGVNAETSRIILEKAMELGYSPVSRITRIRLLLIKKHGRIVTDTPFFSSLIEAIENEARASECEITITTLVMSAPDYEVSLANVLADRESAILLLATELTHEDILPFETCGLPVVMLDGWFPRTALDCVLISNTDSTYEAACYLIARGHTRIGYLRSSLPISNFYYREQGYLRALAEHDLKPAKSDTYELDPTLDGSYRDMAEKLKTAGKLPTAFIADNDMIALGAVKALNEAGINVPKRCSVIGFDDLPYCEINTPALTTIKVDKQEMGVAAVRQLIYTIQKPEHTKMKIEICTELVERASVLDLTMQK